MPTTLRPGHCPASGTLGLSVTWRAPSAGPARSTGARRRRRSARRPRRSATTNRRLGPDRAFCVMTAELDRVFAASTSSARTQAIRRPPAPGASSGGWRSARRDACGQPGSPVTRPGGLLRLEPILLGHQEALRLCDHVETVRTEQSGHCLGGPAGQRGGSMKPRVEGGRLDGVMAQRGEPVTQPWTKRTWLGSQGLTGLFAASTAALRVAARLMP